MDQNKFVSRYNQRMSRFRGRWRHRVFQTSKIVDLRGKRGLKQLEKHENFKENNIVLYVFHPLTMEARYRSCEGVLSP